MIRVNKVKFKQAIDTQYKNHEKYDTMYLFIGFLEENKIWNEFFSEIHKYTEQSGMNQLLEYFFERKDPELWVTSAFVFSGSKRGSSGIHFWNEISSKWRSILKQQITKNE